MTIGGQKYWLSAWDNVTQGGRDYKAINVQKADWHFKPEDGAWNMPKTENHPWRREFYVYAAAPKP